MSVLSIKVPIRKKSGNLFNDLRMLHFNHCGMFGWIHFFFIWCLKSDTPKLNHMNFGFVSTSSCNFFTKFKFSNLHLFSFIIINYIFLIIHRELSWMNHRGVMVTVLVFCLEGSEFELPFLYFLLKVFFKKKCIFSIKNPTKVTKKPKCIKSIFRCYQDCWFNVSDIGNFVFTCFL